MSERNRRRQHLGMITAKINLKIGSARERSFNAHYNLPCRGLRHGKVLDPKIFFAVKDSGIHLSFHITIFPELTPIRIAPAFIQLTSSQLQEGWMTIFIESGFGSEANCIASSACSIGKRCEINFVRSKPFW